MNSVGQSIGIYQISNCEVLVCGLNYKVSTFNTTMILHLYSLLTVLLNIVFAGNDVMEEI